MSNQIQLYSQPQGQLEAITQLGQAFAKSGFAGCDKVEQGVVLAWECFVTGKSPTQITRTFHIMDGKLSKKALAALAEFRGIGGKQKWVKDGTDGKEAVLELTLDGNTITSRFTMDEAKAQGLIRAKSAWEKSPANMLRARCITNGVAMLAPEIFAGDVEDEAPQREAASLLAVVAAPPQVTPQVEKVIDVQVVANPDEKAEAAMGLAPVVADPEPTLTAPTEPAKPFAAAVDDKGRLTVETQQAIIAAVGPDNVEKLLNYLVNGNKWLKPLENLSALTVARANTILGNPAGVLRKIEQGAK